MSRLQQLLTNEVKPFLFSTLAILIYGLFINLLSLRFHALSGGLPGYGLIVNFLSGFPTGLFLLIVNSLLILASFVITGAKIGLRSIYGYVLLSLSIDLFANLLQLTLLPNPSFSTGLWATALFGLIGGIAIGSVIHHRYSVAGYSLIVHIVHKYRPIPAPTIMLALDAILALAAWVFLGPRQAVYLAANALTFWLTMKLTLTALKKP